MSSSCASSCPGWGISLGPYLLALSSPLGLWLGNLTEEPGAGNVLATFAVAGMVTLAADCLARRVIADRVLAALATVGWVVLFFGYGHVFAVCGPAMHLQHRHFLPLWLALFAVTGALLFWLRRSRFPHRLCVFLQTVGPILLGTQVACAVPVLWAQLPEAGEAFGSSSDRAEAAPATPDREAHPDVYYIILDGYAREDVLRQLYGFDNRPFLDALTERGFYVADRARSNYAQTRLSLPSSLAMEYLPEMPAADAYELHHRPLRQLRKQGRVVGRLRQAGYRYRYVGSQYYPIDKAADEQCTFSGRDGTYLRAFVSTTVLEVAIKGLKWCDDFTNPADVTEYQFRHIARPKDDPAPLYTFAHIACPHEPFVYDRNGPLPARIPDDEATPDDYIEQLRYLNDRVLELIDRIDSTSGREAVILLQADHGPDFQGMPSEPNRRQFDERMSIFSAYRYPPEARRRLYPSITPVNSFRALFSGLFGDTLPLLEDRSFYSSYETPFQYVEMGGE